MRAQGCSRRRGSAAVRLRRALGCEGRRGRLCRRSFVALVVVSVLVCVLVLGLLFVLDVVALVLFTLVALVLDVVDRLLLFDAGLLGSVVIEPRGADDDLVFVEPDEPHALR